MKGAVLIADDDRELLKSLEKTVRHDFDTVFSISNPNRIPEMLKKNNIDIALINMNFRSGVHNGNEGFFWMREIFSYDRDISVIIIADISDTELAVKAIKEGAVDYILKPYNEVKLLATLNAAMQLRNSRLETSNLRNDNLQLKREINKTGERIVQGASPTMINVMNIVRKVASTDANVLITGENGTGKELVAREIHRMSKRSGELMVTVDMGSITETLFESELFGHVKGAFTDAREERKGKLESADKGTLFLDEIGNLSLQAQAKLLRVLQDRQVVKVGSNKLIPFDVRLICATNRDLQAMVRSGEFREDLLYRINTILIEVPPLRDRVDDIPILANHFLKINAERYGKEGMKFTTHALEKLTNHDWPGNVRELQHAIEKAVILCDSSSLKPADFVLSAGSRNIISSEMTLDEMEKKMMVDSIRRHEGNMSVVALKLGITRQTLYNKMKKYGI